MNLLPLEVSEACQINDLDLDIVRGHHADNVSEACQINDLDLRIYGQPVYGQINVYGVTTKSERHKRSYWTRTADGNGIGGRKAPVPYGS